MVELINILLECRTKAHIMHWQTKSYSQHKALETLYEGLTGLTDELVEEFQGIYGIITGYTISIKDGEDVLVYLKAVTIEIEKNRYKWIDKGETSLQNTLDEIMRLLYTTIYKVTNLK